MSNVRLNRAYLLLGSNIDPLRYLPAAIRELCAFGRVGAVSRVWESAPFGTPGNESSAGPAATFLNDAVLLETELSAGVICADAVPRIEERLGRVRDPAR